MIRNVLETQVQGRFADMPSSLAATRSAVRHGMSGVVTWRFRGLVRASIQCEYDFSIDPVVIL